MKTTLSIALIAALTTAGCATDSPSSGRYSSNDGYPYTTASDTHRSDTYRNDNYRNPVNDPQIGGSRAAGQAAVGAAAGAVAGNVLGYLSGSDRKTATLLGAVVGGGIGYWRGMQADRTLQEAQMTSEEIARIQAGQNAYRYEEPRLYARESSYNNEKIAAFDKLETPIPSDAVNARSSEATTVLRKLGNLAAKTNSEVVVYGPTREARDFMINEIRNGAGRNDLRIGSTYGASTRVIIGQVPTA